MPTTKTTVAPTGATFERVLPGDLDALIYAHDPFQDEADVDKLAALFLRSVGLDPSICHGTLAQCAAWTRKHPNH